MNSSINITFNEDFASGKTLTIVQNDNGAITNLLETWVHIRNAPFKVSAFGGPTAIVGERTAINFVTAFNLDYNSFGQFVVSRVGNDVIITTTSPSITFESPTSNGDIDFQIINNADGQIAIETATFSAATVPCTHVRVSMATDNLSTKVISPISVDPNAANPVVFDWPRGETILLQVENEDGVQASQTLTLPALLLAENFGFTINGSPNGSTVIITNSYSSGLELEYSLDDIEWQSSSVFAGIAAGEYTLYIRDQLGCSTSKTFTVDEFGINAPYFYISKSNSIRYAQRITFGDSANYKKDENTLSYEADVKIPYMEVQQFQTADKPKTQFKSNYSENITKVIRANGGEVALIVTQKTANIGRREKRDARKYNYGSGLTGLYFISGNIYDYDTDAVTSTYALNGTLPLWAKVGNYVVIDNAWFRIDDIVFDETKNADVILFTSDYSGADAAVIVGSIYNIHDYEVFEFELDMAPYLGEDIQVRINNNDSNFPSLIHLSEQINVAVRHVDTVEIKYRNIDNTDVFYATGIEHIIRIPIVRAAGGFPEEKTETYKTDTNVILLQAENYEGDEFSFEPVTKEIMRKILLALSHERLFIDEVGYVKTETPEVEGPLDDTNLYVIKAKLLKAGYVYSNQPVAGESLYNGESMEVPGLVDYGGGLVRY